MGTPSYVCANPENAISIVHLRSGSERNQVSKQARTILPTISGYIPRHESACRGPHHRPPPTTLHDYGDMSTFGIWNLRGNPASVANASKRPVSKKKKTAEGERPSGNSKMALC